MAHYAFIETGHITVSPFTDISKTVVLDNRESCCLGPQSKSDDSE